MLNFILGVIAGLAWGVIGLVIALRVDKSPLLTKAINTAHELWGAKGSVIEPKSDDIIAMENMFEENDKKGRDTPMEDIL